MTVNDRQITKALLRISKKRRNTMKALLAGDLWETVDQLEQLTDWVNVARRRAKDLLNRQIFPPSKGPMSG